MDVLFTVLILLFSRLFVTALSLHFHFAFDSKKRKFVNLILFLL